MIHPDPHTPISSGHYNVLAPLESFEGHACPARCVHMEVRFSVLYLSVRHQDEVEKNHQFPYAMFSLWLWSALYYAGSRQDECIELDHHAITSLPDWCNTYYVPMAHVIDWMRHTMRWTSENRRRSRERAMKYLACVQRAGFLTVETDKERMPRTPTTGRRPSDDGIIWKVTFTPLDDWLEKRRDDILEDLKVKKCDLSSIARLDRYSFAGSCLDLLAAKKGCSAKELSGTARKTVTDLCRGAWSNEEGAWESNRNIRWRCDQR